jgi:hypothetical protein
MTLRASDLNIANEILIDCATPSCCLIRRPFEREYQILIIEFGAIKSIIFVIALVAGQTAYYLFGNLPNLRQIGLYFEGNVLFSISMSG